MYPALELEQITEGGYFNFKGTIIRIEEIHFPFLPSIRYFLAPIELNRNQISMLGFAPILNGKFGEFERSASNGERLFLKRTENDVWQIGIGEYLTKSIVKYVHELQRVYFGLFNELLRRRGDEPKPPMKHTYYIMKGKDIRVPSTFDTSPGKYHNTLQYHQEHIPYTEQLYYLTFDCTLLIRNIDFAIWKVTEESPIFELGSRKWGLHLVAGKSITSQDTFAAGKWLQTHLIMNNLKEMQIS